MRIHCGALGSWLTSDHLDVIDGTMDDGSGRISINDWRAQFHWDAGAASQELVRSMRPSVRGPLDFPHPHARPSPLFGKKARVPIRKRCLPDDVHHFECLWLEQGVSG